MSKFYVFGSLNKLKARFPGYAGRDERTLSNGESVFEVDLTQGQVDDLEDDGLTCRDHASTVDYIRSVEPDPTTEAEASSALYTESELSAKVKADLVKIAYDEFGMTTVGEDLTKATIISAILAAQEAR